ncbi:MAG: PD-(D/E)XK nuclease family protein [Syntrophotaleaceae bacterium]
MAVETMDILSAAERGALVLTVNQRLARHLVQAYDRRQQEQGRTVWSAPSIVFYRTWQRQVAGRLRLADKTLNSIQALRLWERAVEQEEQSSAGGSLLRASEAARGAAQAHQLLCEYSADFTPAEGGEDHRAFLRWRRRWQELCRAGGWDDPALVPGKLAQALETAELPLPDQMWLAGFDEQSPTFEALCHTLQARGVVIHHWMPPPCPVHSGARVGYADLDEEVRCCARWARHLLEGDKQSIGIIALDMAVYQSRLQRIFREELSPASLLPGAGAEKAFNLSLGTPLLAEGMVVAAFQILGLGRRATLDNISYLLRSPFVWGYSGEQHARAILDRELRNLRLPELPLHKVRHFAERGFKKKLGRADIFARQLEIIQAAQEETEPRLPGAWAYCFAELLDRCQWPGDRSLTSREYQVFTAWKELLAGMAALDAVSDPMGRGEALALLRRLAGEEVFQPEGSAGRVQVLGALEASGMQFDALWLLGAHDESLPAVARPNGFIPTALQRRLKMPHADAARELDFAHKVATRLLVAAPELVVSWPQSLEGRERLPSPLVKHLPLIQPELAASCRPGLLIQAEAAPLAEYIDERGTPIPEGSRMSGGTAILKDQALCPFRAYARHRLGAWGLASAGLGLNGLDRGSLVHRMLELFWLKTGDWQTLTNLDADAWGQLSDACVKQALDELEAERRIPLSSSQRVLERRRLLKLLGEWLQIEAQRPPFCVDTLEAWHRESFGALTLQTRIDRIDRLADGSQVIIDYKTGLATVGDWLGERPVEPQLPLYTLGRRGSELAAVAFAKVRGGESGFVGLGREGDLIPGVSGVGDHRQLQATEIGDWEQLLGSWRDALQQLGDEFSLGHAVVDPVNSRQACERCDLQALCRIADRNACQGEEVLS